MQVALTIAGSDSGGGAGIQADLKTFFRFGVFGTSAITAITAQNTLGVSEWQAVSPDLVRAQMRAVLSDLTPAAVKSGMLANGEIIRVVADELRNSTVTNYVLDPVMVATSGDLLIETSAVEVIRSHLLPLATLVTPNADEASVLIGESIADEQGMRRAAEGIAEMGAEAVLLKGGHVHSTETVIDVLFDGDFTVFRHPRIDTTSTHGTGCTLSAAIAAHLAMGVPLRSAVEKSIDYVHAAMLTAPRLGAGHGPLNHFAGGSSETNSRTSA
jgi:hydroxymethylpyrimidine kinase/phosphomethylpyrimidine kinase